MPLRPLTMDEESEISNALRRLDIAPTILEPSEGDYYRVATVSKKDQGCQACRPITRGTRILEEAPLFSLLLTSGNTLDPSNSEPLTKALGNLTKHDLDLFNTLGPVTANSLKRFARNAYEMPNEKEANESSEKKPSEEGPGEQAPKQKESGVFVNAARFKHSCLPNAFWTWNEHLGADARGRLTIHAIRDIATGEEIFINYRTEDSQKCRAERKKELEDVYDFRCNCPACDVRAPNAAQREVNRERIREIIQAQGSGDDPTIPGPRQRYFEFIELQNLDKLLETEGIVYPQLARGHGWMAQWCARELSQEPAVLDRQKCRELGLKAARSKLDLDIVCNGHEPSEVLESLAIIRRLA